MLKFPSRALTSHPRARAPVARRPPQRATSEKSLSRALSRLFARRVRATATAQGKVRGYAFIEFEREADMRAAYKRGDGRKIDGRRVLVAAMPLARCSSCTVGTAPRVLSPPGRIEGEQEERDAHRHDGGDPAEAGGGGAVKGVVPDEQIQP